VVDNARIQSVNFPRSSHLFRNTGRGRCVGGGGVNPCAAFFSSSRKPVGPMRCEAVPSGQAGSATLHKRPPSPHLPSGFAAMPRSPMPSFSPAPVGRSAMTPNLWRSPSAFDDLPALATRPALRSPITASSG